VDLLPCARPGISRLGKPSVIPKVLHGVEAPVGGREPAVELAGTYLQRVMQAPCENFRDD